ncbi:MAG TPA: hypothetical protein PL000_22030 [Anaerolineales bacterium]|nr:hypothetical protein [Anaerolineales bacterium]
MIKQIEHLAVTPANANTVNVALFAEREAWAAWARNSSETLRREWATIAVVHQESLDGVTLARMVETALRLERMANE